jgi:hypothetical protein
MERSRADSESIATVLLRFVKRAAVPLEPAIQVSNSLTRLVTSELDQLLRSFFMKCKTFWYVSAPVPLSALTVRDATPGHG